MADVHKISEQLIALGCPPERSMDMAGQLDKRARQLATARGRSYEAALKHLLSLMARGWNSPFTRPPNDPEGTSTSHE